MAHLIRLPPRPWLPATSAAYHDPVSIGVAVLVNIGYAGTISGALAAGIGLAVIGAAAIGVALLVSQVFTQAPKLEDMQQVLRQPFGPRRRSYGRVKIGGNLAFFESRDGSLYVQQTINHGEISAVQEIWFNDQQVTVDGGGDVEEAPWNRGDGNHVANLQVKLGAADQTVHASLDSAFAEVDSTHRLRGMANALIRFDEVAAEDISEVYGQGNPSVRLVIDASLVEDVRTEAIAWSDNPGNIIYDYLCGVDGAGFPYGAGFLPEEVNRESFAAFADLSDEAVLLAGGGSIKRYRLWGSYTLDEEFATVLQRMLKSCDGELTIDTEGRVAIRGGQWVAPTLVLDADEGHIIAAEFRQGNAELAAFNELTISYLEPGLDYSTGEAEVWVDSANIALRGAVLPESIEFTMCPHHAQARRLGKIHTRKSNPRWSGQVVTNFNGFNAIGEETVTIRFAPLGIDESFRIERIEILDDLTGVRLSVSSLDATAYGWNAATEQGADPPTPPDTASDDELAPPADIDAVAEARDLSGSLAAVIVVTWTLDSRPLSYQAQYRVASPTGPWVPMTVSPGAGSAESGIVSDGETYEVRVRSVSPGGVPGSWSSLDTVVVTVDVTPPAAVTGVGGTGGSGSIQFDWTAPNSANYGGARLYWNTVDSFGTATLAATEYGAPNAADSRTVTGISAGTRYGWVVAINGSGVAATEVATGAVTVT